MNSSSCQVLLQLCSGVKHGVPAPPHDLEVGGSMSALSDNRLDGFKKLYIALWLYKNDLFPNFFVQVRGGSRVVENSITDPVIGGSNLAAAQPQKKIAEIKSCIV